MKTIKQHITNNELSKAIKATQALVNQHKLDDTSIIALASRFTKLRQDKTAGVLSEKEYNIQRNRLVDDLQDYIKTLPKKPIIKRPMVFFLLTLVILIIGIAIYSFLVPAPIRPLCPEESNTCEALHEEVKELAIEDKDLERHLINYVLGTQIVGNQIEQDIEGFIQKSEKIQQDPDCQNCLRSQIYLNGTGLSYSYLRQIMIYERDSLRGQQYFIKASKEAIKYAQKTLELIEQVPLSSKSCQKALNDWVHNNEHINRYNTFLLLGMAFNFKYDPNTKINATAINEQFEKISKPFLKKYGFDAYELSDILTWLTNNNIISKL